MFLFVRVCVCVRAFCFIDFARSQQPFRDGSHGRMSRVQGTEGAAVGQPEGQSREETGKKVGTTLETPLT